VQFATAKRTTTLGARRKFANKKRWTTKCETETDTVRNGERAHWTDKIANWCSQVLPSERQAKRDLRCGAQEGGDEETNRPIRTRRIHKRRRGMTRRRSALGGRTSNTVVASRVEKVAMRNLIAVSIIISTLERTRRGCTGGTLRSFALIPASSCSR